MKRVSTVVGLTSTQGVTVEGGRSVRLIDGGGGGEERIDLGMALDERARGQLAQNLW